ncbi:MAG: FAD-binding oxidoreductase [Phycisphaerales bacterium]|nr:FAD-binding oxidoreductase [Phycisphaerales bacterium]
MRLPVLESSERIASEAEAVARDLGPKVQGEVRTGRLDRGMFAVDASLYEVEPVAVVSPRDARDVHEVVNYCRGRGLPILGRGAGTSLAGQTVNTAVVLDFSRHMNALIAVDPEAMTAQVQPGLVLDVFNAALAPDGLAFGPDVSTSTHATLGGMIMNSSAGAYSLVHGMTDEHVVSIDAILSSGQSVHLEQGGGTPAGIADTLMSGVVEIVQPLAGQIRERFPKILRNTGGYRLDDMLDAIEASTPGTRDRLNLARLLSGSEGTLGLMTEATVRLVRPPGARCLLVASFDSVAAACAPVAELVKTGPAAVELMDATIIDGAAAQPVYAADVAMLPRVAGQLPRAVLMVEFHADSPADAAAKAERCGRSVGLDKDTFVILDDAADQQRAWTIRKVGLGIISKSGGARKALPGLEDCAVPLERFAEFEHAFAERMAAHGTEGVFYAHASVGLLHVRPRFDLSNASERAGYLALMDDMLELVIAHGGSISGEHGDGRIRADLVARFYGPELSEAFARIRALFDPEGLLNPPAESVPDPLGNLRLDATTVAEPAEETYFEWAEGGPLAASRACNGNGLCRREEGGAMCPSYRAMLDERHVPRGRAAALKLAMEGRFNNGKPDWNDPDVEEVLSLCLSCKACRVECPSNVDVGKLKAEYLAQGFASGRRPGLAARGMASIGTLGRIGSALHPLPALALAIPGVAPLLKRVAGIAPSRDLPVPVRSLHRRLAGHRPRTLPADAPKVMLFPDCFTTSFEPRIGIAAVQALEALGYQVEVPAPFGCCGRPAISTGQLETARGQVEKTATSLARAIDAHDPVAVIVLEPSCLSAIHDEWRELKTSLDRAVVESLAERTCSFEQFVVDRGSLHPDPPTAVDEDTRYVVHPHCHAKVDRAVLAQGLEILGLRQVDILDSGCCGMAGGFGYLAKNESLSRRIAGDSLAEPLDQLHGAVLVAPGTSCRHQVADCHGQAAVHPVEVAAGILCSNTVGSSPSC